MVFRYCFLLDIDVLRMLLLTECYTRVLLKYIYLKTLTVLIINRIFTIDTILLRTPLKTRRRLKN